MTTQTEALKLAREVIQMLGAPSPLHFSKDEIIKWQECNASIDEALAQQEGQSNYCLQCEALSREVAALKAQQSNEQSKCNHTKTITRADIDGNQIETTCGECGERVAQQSNEQVEPVAWRWPYKFKDIGETGAYEYHSHEFACLAHLPKGEPLYTHPPVPTAQPKEPEQEPHGLAAYVIGCFSAAQAEGLQEALAETTDERLKDLVERRLMHAFYAAQNTTPPQRKPLTLVELSHIFASIPSVPFDGEWQLELAQAIEAAHGIKE